eukprot:10908162-Lingulodinium_polyedra.AAC.1
MPGWYRRMRRSWPGLKWAPSVASAEHPRVSMQGSYAVRGPQLALLLGQTSGARRGSGGRSRHPSSRG